MKVGIVSLGCAKNRVDSENIAYLFKENNVEIVLNVEDADLILVNTCGFIDASKQESIDTILEMAQYNKILVVTGCLVERYKDELEKELPEVDLFLALRDYPHFTEKLNEIIKDKNFLGEFNYNNRVISTPPYTAFLKISEGCNNRCHYCAIPLIRGGFRSFPMEDLLNQAKKLAESGVKELVVISQDTTRYGEDLQDVNIVKLLKELLKISDFEYIRLLYLYPDEISDELIELIGKEKRLTPYFDIPVQHSSSKILKSMNRRGDRDFLIALFKKIRKMVPNAILRTTLIVGYAGETEDDFEDLCSFIREIRFDHLGAFTYSPEEGTVGATLPNQVPDDVKQERYNKIMEIQQEISYQKNLERINQKQEGIVVGFDDNKMAYLVRSVYNAPDDIDGNIYLYSDEALNLGQKISFVIVDASDYDLYAQKIVD